MDAEPAWLNQDQDELNRFHIKPGFIRNPGREGSCLCISSAVRFLLRGPDNSQETRHYLQSLRVRRYLQGKGLSGKKTVDIEPLPVQVLCNNPKKYAVVEPEGKILGQKCVDIVIR